jgi:hypothetical protein
MPNPFMPCGPADPKTALWPVWGCRRLRLASQQGGLPVAVLYPFGHPTLYAYGFLMFEIFVLTP